MKFQNLIIGFMLILYLSACSSNVMDQEETPLLSQPESGKATITGRVLSEKADEPFTDTIVRLAEVVRQEDSDGLYVLDQAFSPGAKTDEKGFFVFENVEAMEYVIIVGNVESIYEVITKESNTPKIWNAQPDEILQVGDLFVLLEPTQP